MSHLCVNTLPARTLELAGRFIIIIIVIVIVVAAAYCY